VIVWYDDRNCLYSTSELPTPLTITSEDDQQQLNINSLTSQRSTSDIYDYIDGQVNVYPFDAVRILETLLKKSLQDRVHMVGNKYYFEKDKPRTLNSGFEERLGFMQALNLLSKSLTLNLQTKLTTFYPDISLMQFISLQLGHNHTPDLHECNRLNHVLRGCVVVTQQSNWKQAYEIDKFDHQTPDQRTIESGETLTEYYREAKNIKLVHTELLCIQVYSTREHDKPVHLPLEVCHIQAWQIYDKPVSCRVEIVLFVVYDKLS
jgi:hypothetical protein